MAAPGWMVRDFGLAFESNRVSIPAMGRYCLGTLMSSDRTKQICLWMTIYIYIYIYIICHWITYKGRYAIKHIWSKQSIYLSIYLSLFIMYPCSYVTFPISISDGSGFSICLSHAFVHTYTHTNADINTHTNTRTHTHIYIYTYMCVCVCVNVSFSIISNIHLIVLSLF